MTSKLTVIDQLGETGLLLPELVNRGLDANNRIKYYLTLLQAAKAHAEHPTVVVSDLRREREASGVDDVMWDELVGASRPEVDGMVWIPQGKRLHDLIFSELEGMLQPILKSANTKSPPDSYAQRFDDLRAHASSCEGDLVPAADIDALTRAANGSVDSVHRLVMDLHQELNHQQAVIARESVDGANTYGLGDTDRPLVQAFMRGLNATAPLKFDHPGLSTTATRMGKRLSIQNDLGTTDVHVIVIHVEDLSVTVIYTDIHRQRMAFLKDMLSSHGVQWSEGVVPEGAQYEMSVGRVTADDLAGVEEYLTFLASRLVFLIDWNRARKRLQRFLKKSDAVAVLKWAADNNVGHRAFLQAGDVRLVYTALERTRAELRYGMRLDEFLGREDARVFLQSVLRLTAEGLKSSRSLRLIQDEIEAELLTLGQMAEHGVFGMAADHATFISMLAERLHHAIARSGGRTDAYVARTADLAKRWETQADEIVKRARGVLGQSPAGGAMAQLVVDADDVVDALEEAAFFLTLLPAPAETATVSALCSLAELISTDARHYVRLLEHAKDLPHASSRSEVDAFLVVVDQVVELEHAADAAEREVQAVVVKSAENFRELHVVSAIAQAFEQAADSLARCALTVRDRVLAGMADRP